MCWRPTTNAQFGPFARVRLAGGATGACVEVATPGRDDLFVEADLATVSGLLTRNHGQDTVGEINDGRFCGLIKQMLQAFDTGRLELERYLSACAGRCVFTVLSNVYLHSWTSLSKRFYPQHNRGSGRKANPAPARASASLRNRKRATGSAGSYGRRMRSYKKGSHDLVRRLRYV